MNTTAKHLKFFGSCLLLASTFTLSACGDSAKKTETPPPKAFQDPPLTPEGDRVAEVPAVTNWFTKSPGDGVEGTQADRAYIELGLAPAPEPIIVAVIDGGMDVNHEDLKGRVWVNPGEIKGNRIDDDGNGYVDDVNGWNFLGSVDADGNPVNLDAATLEVTRESARLKKLKARREAKGDRLTDAEAKLLAETSAEVEKNRKAAQDSIDKNAPIVARFEEDYEALKASLNGVAFSDLTLEALKTAVIADEQLAKRRDALVAYAESVEFKEMWRIETRINYARETLETQYNESFDPRAEIIGDDPSDFTDRNYGNPDVAGGNPETSADHGTHVAGIIAAVRGNAVGIDGVANDVRVMSVRAVPNGDEYDKDVANAVRYAVDNGARIINMSFGKDYSPHKAEVDEAFRYAAEKNVLIVHAAGNSAQNTDVKPSYPNATLTVQEGETGSRISGWIDVGASAAKLDLELVAEFSNYGTKTVELFAPGVEIVSSVPYKNGELGMYDSYSGTSMASPVVAGVAALVLSQRPDLGSTELRKILIETARGHREHVVRLPFEDAPPVPLLSYFGALSQTGGIVDAFEALKSALGR